MRHLDWDHTVAATISKIFYEYLRKNEKRARVQIPSGAKEAKIQSSTCLCLKMGFILQCPRLEC